MKTLAPHIYLIHVLHFLIVRCFLESLKRFMNLEIQLFYELDVYALGQIHYSYMASHTSYGV